MTTVPFPQLSDERPDAIGVLATWYSAEGEAVADGQLIGEVQMDKVDAEVVAPVSGTIHLVVAEGDEVAQGAPIAEIA